MMFERRLKMAGNLCDCVINAVDVEKLNKIERLIHLNLDIKLNDYPEYPERLTNKILL